VSAGSSSVGWRFWLDWRIAEVMNAMIDTLKAAKSFEGAGFAKAQAESLATTIAEATSASREDMVTKDYLKGEMAVLKNDIVRWMLGSQVMLIVVLVALANFTKLLAAHS
jgi:hypothetical protein